MQGRVAALVGLDQVEIQSYEVPAPGPGEAVVRITRANVCGSDVHNWHYKTPRLRDVVLGHEFVGEVETLGEGVTTDFAGSPVQEGDRVVVAYFSACRKCVPCTRGDFNMCLEGLNALAMPPREAPHFHGAFATHYFVRADHYFYKVPASLPDTVVAGVNCGLAQVMFSLHGDGLRRGETIVVQGAGGLGLYAAAVADDLGARVIVIDGFSDRLKMALDFGASETIDMSEYPTAEARAARVMELTGGVGADCVLEVTGVAKAFEESVLFARDGGRIASVGNINVGEGNEIVIAPAIFTRKSLRVTGYKRYDPWFLKTALDFLDDTIDKYPFADLSDRDYSLEEVAEALERSESGLVARPAIVLK